MKKKGGVREESRRNTAFTRKGLGAQQIVSKKKFIGPLREGEGSQIFTAGPGGGDC